MKAARANAAFFNTAATQASNLLPKARAEAGKMRMASAPGECLFKSTEAYTGSEEIE